MHAYMDGGRVAFVLSSDPQSEGRIAHRRTVQRHVDVVVARLKWGHGNIASCRTIKSVRDW